MQAQQLSGLTDAERQEGSAACRRDGDSLNSLTLVLLFNVCFGVFDVSVPQRSCGMARQTVMDVENQNLDLWIWIIARGTQLFALARLGMLKEGSVHIHTRH